MLQDRNDVEHNLKYENTEEYLYMKVSKCVVELKLPGKNKLLRLQDYTKNIRLQAVKLCYIMSATL